MISDDLPQKIPNNGSMLLCLCYSPLVTLATAACGDRLEEALVMIKSALVLSTGPIHVHLFTDDHLMKQFREKVR